MTDPVNPTGQTEGGPSHAAPTTPPPHFTHQDRPRDGDPDTYGSDYGDFQKRSGGSATTISMLTVMLALSLFQLCLQPGFGVKLAAIVYVVCLLHLLLKALGVWAVVSQVFGVIWSWVVGHGWKDQWGWLPRGNGGGGGRTTRPLDRHPRIDERSAYEAQQFRRAFDTYGMYADQDWVRPRRGY